MTSLAQPRSAHDPQTGDGERSGDAHPDELVWDTVAPNWVWASRCGRFKIERFVTGGGHERVGTSFTWPDRFRALKRAPEWYFEAAPSEPTIDAAKRACEALA